MFNNLFSNFNLTSAAMTEVSIASVLNPKDNQRLSHYNTLIDFWRGIQWNGVYSDDRPEITQNWCRRIANEFMSYEFTGGLSFKFDKDVETTVLPFLQEIWEDNSQDSLMSDMALGKSITGDSFLLIEYVDKYFEDESGKQRLNPDFNDPFGIYDKGRIIISVVPSVMCYPKFKDGFDGEMESCTLMVPIKVTGEDEPNPRYRLERRVYYNDVVQIYNGKSLVGTRMNPYGVIPIVHFKNLPNYGEYFGVSDLEDIVSLNVELNTKTSDMSQIIDYHASPITLIYGAKTAQISRDANKVWSGMPEKAKVENLELKSDMSFATNYILRTKDALHEVGAMPKLATGAAEIPANISGVALQILFGPMVKNVNEKRKCTEKGLRLANKIILKIGLKEGLISYRITNTKEAREFYNHDIVWGSILPKDDKTELESIQQELKMGLTSRREAMKRLGKDSIEEQLADIDKDIKENPFIHGITGTILSAGQILVNNNNGEKIAEGNEPQPLSTQSNPLTKQPEQKPVGTNKEGTELKVPSGLGNKNTNGVE